MIQYLCTNQLIHDELQEYSMGQRQHSLVLALILFFTLIGSVQAENEEQVITLTDGLEPHDGLHYFAGTVSSFEVSLKNTGINDVSIELNPSCMATFQIINENNEIVYDFDNHRLCPNQKRGETLDSSEILDVGTINYDWTNDDGFLPEGTYIIRTIAGFDTVPADLEINLKHPLSLPSDLHFEADFSPFSLNSDSSTSSDVLLMSAKIYNSGMEAITITGLESCDVLWSITNQPTSLSNMGCGNGVTIQGGESHHLGWITYSLSNIETNGVLTSSIWMMGSEDSATTQEWNHNLETLEDTSGLSLIVDSLSLRDGVAPTGSEMDFDIFIRNDGPIARTVEYDTSCPSSIYIVNEMGALIHDDAWNDDDCQGPIETIKIQPSSIINLQETSISATYDAGCGWHGSQMAAVIKIPGQGISTSLPFEVKDGLVAEQCRANLQSTDNIDLVIDSLIETEKGIELDLSVTNLGEEDFTLMWEDDCVIRTNAMRDDDSRISSSTNGCGIFDSVSILKTGDSIDIPDIPVDLILKDDILDGTHLIQITLRSYPSLEMEITHVIESPQEEEITNEEIVESNEEEIQNEKQEEVIISTLLEGTWNHVRTETGGCWVLTTPSGEETVLVGSEDVSLNPVTGDQGAFRIINSPSDIPEHCSKWEGGFVVQEVIDQWSPENLVLVSSETENEPPETIVELIVPATAVVVTTSLLSLCLVFLLNTEWIRIATLNGGLALIGMVRRRDYDGEFQRGRVIGYLVANPGVHFRALLGALDMSNGQLAHHLKVLENQELLWRRRDGRMMRYYPSTVDQHLDGDNLPVPLLTPDPNSLQGRILDLLDATGNEIVNLSQKELSDRLESSQQLISHHLKTLEGYGLIERDKVGLRYRYRLTREAIFLLESTDFPQDR